MVAGDGHVDPITAMIVAAHAGRAHFRSQRNPILIRKSPLAGSHRISPGRVTSSLYLGYNYLLFVIVPFSAAGSRVPGDPRENIQCDSC